MHNRKSPTSPYYWYRNGKPAVGGLLPDGAHLGLGVFETMRARMFEGRASIIGLSLHMERLRDGLSRIGASVMDEADLLGTIRDAVCSFGWESSPDCLLRVVGYRSEWLLFAAPWKPSLDSERGATSVTVQAERPRPELKTCSAIVSVLAREEAARRGADEALLVSDGELREGAWSNVFLVLRDGRLVTPSERVLPGVTRELVLRNAGPVERRAVSVEELFSASEAFLTQATHGIIPLVSVDGRAIGSGEPGPLTSELRSRYERLLGESAI